MSRSQPEIDPRAAKRAVRRLACEVFWEDERQRAVILNISSSGLFVRANTMPSVGTKVLVRIRRPGGAVWEIDAEVARKLGMQEAPAWSRGVGLVTLQAPPGYDEFVAELTDGSAATA